ncbi:MAG: tripartite tricarboxylate transporter substrate binding protein [Xanthobacteraceae bacterium]
MRKFLTVMTLAACLAGTGFASAQDYPNRPITLVIPFAAGGPTDLLGRAMAPHIGEILGQQVAIENVGGAGGILGSLQVAHAAPDGYTVLLGTAGTHAQNQSLYRHPRYNAVTDFTPVALVAELPIVLVVNRDLPVKNLKEFKAYANKNKDRMQYGSAGAGSAAHLGCLLANRALGIQIRHVPYSGTALAMDDLIAGRIDYVCDIITTAKRKIDPGEVKPIAILAQARSPALPNVATALEQGVMKLEAYTWNAFFLPKGAPADVVKKLNWAIMQAAKSPAVRQSLESLGAVFVSDDRMTPEYLGQFVRSEIENWAVPIKASGVSIE